MERTQQSLGFVSTGYSPKFDAARLKGQRERVYNLMKDGQWRTLPEIAEACRPGTETSISACLRTFRRPIEKGGLNLRVDKRRRGDLHSGLWEYKVIV